LLELLIEIALYIVVAVVFGYIMGAWYANTRNKELYTPKEQKQTKIISEKNSAIIQLKSELRSAHRKIAAINQGYELQTNLLNKKEKELTKLSSKDKIINLLERKIQHLTKENA
jgi:hypothetical protein